MQLSRVLVGKKIERVEVRNYKVFSGKKEALEGKKVLKVGRKAKVLLVDLEGETDVAFHFKMTGQLIYVDGKERVVGGHPTEDFTGPMPSVHTRVIFYLDEGALYFNDQRLFGWVKTGPKEEIAAMKFLQDLGPEPFDINEKEFAARVGKSKRPIKLVLMDQTVISGVGNIYANDALWEAEINPRRPANTLNHQQMIALYNGVVKVLAEGIQYGGATAADAKYIDLHGLGGHYQEHFKVYDREGQECLRGNGIVHKFVLGGRGTYVCPKCQE